MIGLDLNSLDPAQLAWLEAGQALFCVCVCVCVCVCARAVFVCVLVCCVLCEQNSVVHALVLAVVLFTFVPLLLFCSRSCC